MSGSDTYAPGSWSKNAVSVTFNCQPAAGASIANATQPVTVSNEGSGQFVNGVCTDIAGNQARITAGPINIDRTAPTMRLSQSSARQCRGLVQQRRDCFVAVQ